jgi:hypothetical protein
LRLLSVFLFQRPNEFSTFFHAGQLFQQWVVDIFGSIDQDRLQWIQQNQKKIRCDVYKSLHEVINHNGNPHPRDIGKASILPSSYTGGPRYMQQADQDVIAE